MSSVDRDRVGEVYEWTIEGDIILVVAKRERVNGSYEWECRSLFDMRASWITESFFIPENNKYLRRVA